MLFVSIVPLLLLLLLSLPSLDMYVVSSLLLNRIKKKNVPAYIHGTNHFAVLTDMNCNEILSIVQFTVSLSISALLICWPIQFNKCMCMGACINGMANHFIRWYEVISTNTYNTHVRKACNNLCRFIVNIRTQMQCLHQITSNLFCYVAKITQRLALKMYEFSCVL